MLKVHPYFSDKEDDFYTANNITLLLEERRLLHFATPSLGNNSNGFLDGIVKHIADFDLVLRVALTDEGANLTGPNKDKFSKTVNEFRSKLHKFTGEITKIFPQKCDEYKFVCVCGAEFIACKGDVYAWDKLSDHEHVEKELIKANTYSGTSACSNPTKSVSFCSSTIFKTSNENSCSETNSEVSLKTVNELDAKQITAEFVKNTYYPKELVTKCGPKATSVHNIIQNFGDGMFRCLVCQVVLTGPGDAYFGHANGRKHHGLRNTDSLQKIALFHQMWDQLDPLLQTHQMYFFPRTYPKIYCDICGVTETNKTLKLHLQSPKHYDNLELGFRNEPNYMNKFFFLNEHLKRPGKHTNIVQKPPDKKAHHIERSFGEFKIGNAVIRLENRLFPQMDYFLDHGTNFWCTVCAEAIPVRSVSLREHIISKSHIKFSRNIIKRLHYTYHCDLCTVVLFTEVKWQEHLKILSHLDKLKSKDKSINYDEYECLNCKITIFGTEEDIASHERSKMESSSNKRAKKKPAPVLSDTVKLAFSSSEKIEEYARALAGTAVQVMQDTSKVRPCCSDLGLVVAEAFPFCNVHPFGSRMTGLGDWGSDLDIYVDVGNMYNGLYDQDYDAQFSIIDCVSNVLKKCQSFRLVAKVPQARTPIITVLHKQTGLKCDLSFRHGLSVENTKFIKLCMDLQPKVRHLILLLKKWLSWCALTERFSSYALTMMIIFYMQTKKYLLSIKQLRTMCSTFKIAGWETLVCDTVIKEMVQQILPCEESVTQLFMGFFDYYRNFKFDTEVVCPLLGETVLKKTFHCENGLKLPKEMDAYVKKIQENEDNEVFRYLSEMCIQDPFDLSHNLTKACTIEFVNKFQIYCTMTYNYLLEKTTDNSKTE